MKGLAFLKQSWLISLLGVLALALLIWFIGPLLAIAGWQPLAAEFNRWLAILILLLFWGLYHLLRYLLARHRNRQMLENLAGAPPDPTQQAKTEELAELKARFDEALGILKQAKLDRRRGVSYLYQLPWYIIIGPPGAGKTTALLNSGLHFPLADRMGKGKIQGVGGTRNCDWFFSDEAVLLDTAGRYTTQDSHQAVDTAAWLGFLELLKKYRRHRPINGVLVAVSLADLMQAGATERTTQARMIKERIQELHQQLGIRFPIYVLFTKADLVAGFTEFFANLGKEDRSQVWGMTFPLHEEAATTPPPVNYFVPEFNALEARLGVRQIERLQQERDGRNRDLIYLFPPQFASLKPVDEEFLQAIFQSSRFEEQALLRGVYFTSGTQEGTPIDRLLGTLAATFGLDRQAMPGFSGKGKSYFITRLLQDVIFQEAALASTNLRLERYRQRLQWAAAAAALLVTGLVAALWVTSYLRNQAYIGHVEQQAQALQTQLQQLPERGDILAVLPALNLARDLPGGYREQAAGIPLLMGFGLYQGDKLGEDAAVPLYQRLLRNQFLPQIMRRLEQQLSQNSDPEYLYESLKVYLMLDDQQHFDADTIKNWLLLDWEQNPGNRASTEQHRALQDHLTALLELLPGPLPYARDGALIERVRARLQQLPPEQRVYNGLKRELDNPLPAFNPSQAGGPSFATVFTRLSGKPLSEGVPGLYTYSGYHEVFTKASGERIKQLAEESWILGKQGQLADDPQALQRLTEAVRNLYLQDYIKQWDGLLSDFNIRHLTSLTESVDIINVLAGPDSPLSNLLLAVAQETTLERPPEPTNPDQPAIAGKPAAPGITSGAPARLEQLRQRLGQAVPGQAPAAEPTNAVDAHFTALHRLVQEGEWAKVTSLLNELHVYLNNMASAKDRGETALEDASKQAGGIIGKLKLAGERQPPPLSRWLKGLADDSTTLTQGKVVSALNVFWGPTLSFCQNSIANRYPLNRSSRNEVTPEDFGRFFGPGGELDQYFQKYLQQFVDTTGKPWKPKDPSLRISLEALQQFQRAAEIREAFFGGGKPLPSVRFQLKPILLGGEVEKFMLDLDGQQFTYSYGPARETAMQWPGPQGANWARVEFSPPLADGRSGLTRDGPWGWFQLLDAAELKPTADPTRFTLIFQLEGRTANLELRASSTINPFNLKALEQFRCPPRL